MTNKIEPKIGKLYLVNSVKMLLIGHNYDIFKDTVFYTFSHQDGLLEAVIVETDFDAMVKEINPPVKRWVNLYSNNACYSYQDREAADEAHVSYYANYAPRIRIACVEVTEGEGL